MMIRANSLLYAVYICLIVSIICGALLYIATLYKQLNQFYNTTEYLYIQNQSAVNFALGNPLAEIPQEKNSGIHSYAYIKQFGVLDVLTVGSFVKSDTVTSTYFIGSAKKDDTCIFLADLGQPLTFAGNVKLIGDKKITGDGIREAFLNNFKSTLTAEGSVEASEKILPEINPGFKKVIESRPANFAYLNDLDRGTDNTVRNSFANETVSIQLTGSSLDNISIRGNFMIVASDSIVIGSNAVLEDVILKAPKIHFQNGFKGNVQAYSSKQIIVGEMVNLQFPSVLCLYNTTFDNCTIEIGKKSTVDGAVVLFGNQQFKIDSNTIRLNENTLVTGEIYCTGKLMAAGKIFGSVYTNGFYYTSDSSTLENCLIDTEINSRKRPNCFYGVTVLNIQTKRYELQKRIF